MAITKMALFTNTMVALPTGLGKTLIAAVVMYNYFRWFPDGKIASTSVIISIGMFISLSGSYKNNTLWMYHDFFPEVLSFDFWLLEESEKRTQDVKFYYFYEFSFTLGFSAGIWIGKRTPKHVNLYK